MLLYVSVSDEIYPVPLLWGIALICHSIFILIVIRFSWANNAVAHAALLLLMLVPAMLAGFGLIYSYVILGDLLFPELALLSLSLVSSVGVTAIFLCRRDLDS